MKTHNLLRRLKKIAKEIGKCWDEASCWCLPYDGSWAYGSWWNNAF